MCIYESHIDPLNGQIIVCGENPVVMATVSLCLTDITKNTFCAKTVAERLSKYQQLTPKCFIPRGRIIQKCTYECYFEAIYLKMYFKRNIF